MEFTGFLHKCQSEPTVGDFESYLSYCVFEKKGAEKRERPGKDASLPLIISF